METSPMTERTVNETLGRTVALLFSSLRGQRAKFDANVRLCFAGDAAGDFNLSFAAKGPALSPGNASADATFHWTMSAADVVAFARGTYRLTAAVQSGALKIEPNGPIGHRKLLQVLEAMSA